MKTVPPTIAVFTKNKLNPAYTAARMGADRIASQLGARVVHYVCDKPDDIEGQIGLIDQAIAQRPDAIALVPVHPTAINAAIQRVHAAGIPVIGYINEFTDDRCVTNVRSDDYPLAVSITRYLCQHMGGKGRVLLVEGPSESVTSRERVRGVRHALRAYPDTAIAGSICGEYQREPARRAMSKWLASESQFDGIIAANDIMAMGVIDALDAAGRSSRIVSVNAIPEAVKAIAQGKLLASADFNALNMASIAIEAAVRHLRGEVLPREIILPVEIVDRSNYASWDSPYEERSLPNWREVVR